MTGLERRLQSWRHVMICTWGASTVAWLLFGWAIVTGPVFGAIAGTWLLIGITTAIGEWVIKTNGEET